MINPFWNKKCPSCGCYHSLAYYDGYCLRVCTHCGVVFDRRWKEVKKK